MSNTFICLTPLCMPCAVRRSRLCGHAEGRTRPRKRRSTHVCESIDFATFGSKFEKPKIAPDPASGARSFPPQLIRIPTAHPDIPLWCTNVSPHHHWDHTLHPDQNLARNGRTAARAEKLRKHISHIGWTMRWTGGPCGRSCCDV